MSQVVTPLDPDTEHARALAARWSRTLAVIERELIEATGPSGPAGPHPTGPAGDRPGGPPPPPPPTEYAEGRAA